MTEAAETILHASCVAAEGRGLLILGRSGSGKSALALDLISLGAQLVSDDRTRLELREGRLLASPPATIAGLIEARHVGILELPHLPTAEVVLAIDLDQTEPDRLPPQRSWRVLGQSVPLLYRPPHLHGGFAILQCLLRRRREP